MTEGRPSSTGATPAELALGTVMLAFDGMALPDSVAARLAAAPTAGVTLFRFSNVDTPAQVRQLTAAIQVAGQRGAGAGAGPRALPLLIAADQECGQLMALGDGTTPFAGNMALGAAGDPGLTERAARAIGLELRAMGVNVDYAPVCDLATNPRNPAVGTRSFGDDPAAVGSHVAAFVRGLQSAGVASGLKHFPGLGGATEDTHHGPAVVDATEAELLARDLVPFRAGIDAGARVVMSAHLAVPGLTRDPAVPSTLSAAVMTDLLRGRLGFDGVSITDALDMRAIPQGPALVEAVIAALAAGVDLLLTAPDPVARDRIEAGLAYAAAGGQVDVDRASSSMDRVDDLRTWLAGFEQPEIGSVGSADHRALARELAARSMTLVRDDDSRLPLRLRPEARVAAIMPRPTDQTPADTSSTVTAGLAAALRRRHPRVDEYIVAHGPTAEEIAAARESVLGLDLVVVGTTAAILEPAQAAFVAALLETGVPVVTVALRTPFDLTAYPGSRTHVSTYGILPPSLDALADSLFGVAGFAGRLPAAVPGLHPTGHGIQR